MLTLVEMSKMALGRDMQVESAVMELYARNSDIMMSIPIKNIDGNAITFLREKVLPNVGFRGINEPLPRGTGQFSKITESLTASGGELDVDDFLVETGGGDIRSDQEELQIKALSLKMTKKIIKGDVSSDPKEFDGLQVRCNDTAMPTIIPAGSSSGGDALSLIKLDELIDSVEDPTHLVMNKTLRRRITAAARNTDVGGYITYDTDAFGRQITKYNDLPILIADKDENYSDIMPFTETQPGGGSAASSSIYCVSFTENGVVGLQNGDMQVKDLGEIPNSPVYRTRIKWYFTLAIMRYRAAARLWGIKNAEVVK